MRSLQTAAKISIKSVVTQRALHGFLSVHYCRNKYTDITLNVAGQTNKN